MLVAEAIEAMQTLGSSPVPLMSVTGVCPVAVPPPMVTHG